MPAWKTAGRNHTATAGALGLPNLANKNTGYPVKPDLQVNNEFFKCKFVPCSTGEIL